MFLNVLRIFTLRVCCGVHFKVCRPYLSDGLWAAEIEHAMYTCQLFKELCPVSF
jgi:hypothetical protein